MVQNLAELSSLGSSLKRSSDVLRNGASSHVLDYEQKFSSLKSLYDNLLSDLIRTEFTRQQACETALSFFGKTSVRFAGVDGTMYSRPLFDLLAFFGGAYASTGTVDFTEDCGSTVRYEEKTLNQAASISCVVPIYINEVPEVDHTFFGGAPPEDVSPNKPLTDDSIISNATIANWIMTFAEYYLAYKLATDTRQDVRIILLDRSLSNDQASLIYDTAKRELWKTRSNLIGYNIDDESVDMNDLTIARQSVCNRELGLPPPRGDYLGYAMVEILNTKDKLREGRILEELGIADEKRANRLRRQLKRFTTEGAINENDGAYSLDPKYATTKKRIQKLLVDLGDRFFYSAASETQTASVMKVMKDGKERWLTTIDLAFLTLFALHFLMEECWKRRILLIGMTKDTAARDFKRQLIPIMHNEGLLRKPVSHDEFDLLPNTDRMILQSASMLNCSKIEPPWSLIEYDSAFRTMIPDRQKRRGYVSGAIRNRIGLERAFVKTYVQLSQAKSDPKLRSNVLLIDRLVYPHFDRKPESLASFVCEFGGADEPVEVILFKDKSVSNRLQTLALNVLAAMAPSSIPEAFGHNKPLFIADKVAKWHYAQFKCIVDTTAAWIANNHKLRRFVFYMSTFRERRATIEQTRREQA